MKRNDSCKIPNICPWQSDTEIAINKISRIIFVPAIIFLIYLCTGLISLTLFHNAGYAFFPGSLISYFLIRRLIEFHKNYSYDKAQERAKVNSYNLLIDATRPNRSSRNQAYTLFDSATNAVAAHFDSPEMFQRASPATTCNVVGMYLGFFAAFASTVLGYSNSAVIEFSDAVGGMLQKMYGDKYGEGSLTALKVTYSEAVLWAKQQKPKNNDESAESFEKLLNGFFHKNTTQKNEQFYNTVARFLLNISHCPTDKVISEQYYDYLPEGKHTIDLLPLTADPEPALPSSVTAVPAYVVSQGSEKCESKKVEIAGNELEKPVKNVALIDKTSVVEPTAKAPQSKFYQSKVFISILVTCVLLLSALLVSEIVDSFESNKKTDAPTTGIDAAIYSLEKSGVSQEDANNIVNNIANTIGIKEKIAYLDECDLDYECKCDVYLKMIAYSNRQDVYRQIIDSGYDTAETAYVFLSTMDSTCGESYSRENKVEFLRYTSASLFAKKTYFSNYIADESALKSLELLEKSGVNLDNKYLYLVADVFGADSDYNKIDVLQGYTHIDNKYKEIIYRAQIADLEEKKYFSTTIEKLKENGGSLDDYLVAKQVTIGVSSQANRHKQIRSALRSKGSRILNILYEAFDASESDYEKGYNEGYTAGKRKSKKDDLGLGLDLPDLSFSIFD